jgi:hypothetical protein
MAILRLTREPGPRRALFDFARSWVEADRQAYSPKSAPRERETFVKRPYLRPRRISATNDETLAAVLPQMTKQKRVLTTYA